MADAVNSKWLKFLLKFKAFLVSKDVLTFSVFLLLSASFWFINWLNKEQEFIVSVPIAYQNIPHNIVPEENLPTEFQVKVKEFGIRYWTYMRKKPMPITINFQQENMRNGRYRISNYELLTKVSANLLTSSTVLSINPESINIRFQDLTEKILPVSPDYKLKLDDQFMLSSAIEIIPDSVQVFGSQSVLDTLTQLYTEHVILQNKADSFNHSVKLKPIPTVNFQTDHVNIRASVEQFTEKSIILPIQFINNPTHLTAIIFPTEVKAVFNIGIKHFQDFQPEDVSVVVDYEDLAQQANKKYSLKIINHKTYISNIRIQPEEVEILLEEQL